jgi:protein-disulfide isomerase
MKTLTIVGCALLVAGSVHADPLEARVKALEAKVKKLEDENARYAEALQFLEKVYDQQKTQQQAMDRSEPATDAMFAVPIATDLANGQVAGASGAAVTIVWAFDLADPYSARMVAVFDDLLAQYKGKLRVVFKNMIVHPQSAVAAHNAGCAAGMQHRFGEFWHAYWKDGYAAYANARDLKTIDRDAVIAIAKKAGLDARRLTADMDGPACATQVKLDQEELSRFHVNGTPTFFVNGSVINGAVPKETLEAAIDDKLAAVAKSGVAPGKYYDDVVMAKGEKKFRSKVDPKP